MISKFLCFVVLSGLSFSACIPANKQVLQAKDVSVHFTAQPFALSIYNSDGTLVLDAAQDGLMAALDKPTFSAQIIPGWDDYRAHETALGSAAHGHMTKGGK